MGLLDKVESAKEEDSKKQLLRKQPLKRQLLRKQPLKRQLLRKQPLKKQLQKLPNQLKQSARKQSVKESLKLGQVDCLKGMN